MCLVSVSISQNCKHIGTDYMRVKYTHNSILFFFVTFLFFSPIHSIKCPCGCIEMYGKTKNSPSRHIMQHEWLRKCGTQAENNNFMVGVCVCFFFCLLCVYVLARILNYMPSNKAHHSLFVILIWFFFLSL